MHTKEAMRATMPATGRENALNRSDEKELIDRCVLVHASAGAGDRDLDEVEILEAIDARWYMARRSDGASPIYCSVWIHAGGIWTSGRGRAGGYGYCKRSQAFADAVRSAGVELSSDVGGRGMSVVREAMHAIADALGVGTVRRIVE